MTIALLYLLGRMPEADVEAYEIHLLECSRCLALTQAAEHLLRFHGKGEGVVIPFRAARAGLWAAQRDWMQTTGPLQRLASQMVEELDRAERDLDAIEAALEPRGSHG